MAIKLLRSRDVELKRRFAREAEVLANLHHPAIVRVLAHGGDGEDLFMALELIDGPNLGERLAVSGPLPWRQVVEIGIQIADALATIHSAGLIHRDVKPANIMLVADGPQAQVKLIDFGWARITDGYCDPVGFTPEPRRATELGLAIGTPGYLPLEAGLVPADERFDVFALGATLYELLTGELPGIEPLRPLHEVNPACDAPADLGVVLTAALALEPGDRTQTAAELGAALAAIRTAHPEHRASRWLDGRYELLGVIGTGAKGEVLLANHRGSGHDVALKFLRSKDPDDLRRFEREAELLALLDAPGLPRFYDHAPQAERPYIAMACAPGVPAARFCLASDTIRLKPAEVLEVGLQAARILKYLHERGVLHRDINANNVIIELGRTPRVTLIDLGCAVLTPAFYTHASRRYLTPPEARVVIPDGGIEKLAWAAPEVKAGEGWTGKSDVYSLGLLLFRLLTGKLPTVAGSPSLPAEIANVILQTLQPRPSDRPTAAQLEMAIADILEEAELVKMADQAAASSMSPGPTELAPTVSSPSAAPTAEPAIASPPPHAPSASPRARIASAPVRAASRGHASFLVVGAAIAACAWWAGRVTAPPLAEHVAADATAASSVVPTAESNIHAGPLAAPVAPAPVLPTMRAALDTVAPRVRACDSQGVGMMVEYETVAGREQFARIAVVGNDDARINDCVRGVAGELRFAPTTSQILHEEYFR